MSRFRTFAVVVVVGATALAGATSAQAAGKTYSISCPSVYPTGRLATTTTGATTRNWTNMSNGDTKQSYWASGGAHASTGYQASSVAAAAPTYSGGSTSCV